MKKIGTKNKEKLSQEQISEIVRLYVEDRVRLRVLEKEFHTKKIRNYIEDAGYKLRNFRDAKRLYPFNENYFDVIDTKDKAYWLGFMYADGCVSKGPNGQFIFQLALKDLEPLLIFRKYLHSEKPITSSKQNAHSFGKDGIQYTLCYSSIQAYNALVKWGCTERKTFTLQFPTFLDKALIPHFIRGYFDGDGTVYTTYANSTRNKKRGNDPNKIICYGFSGTYSFLEDLRKELGLSKSCLRKDYRKTTDCWRINVSAIYKAKEFYTYIYSNCDNLYLKRKKDIFDNYFRERGSEAIIADPETGLRNGPISYENMS